MPSSLVVMIRSRLVCVLTALTLAPGTAAPLLSRAAPVICPVLACACANVLLAPKTKQSANKRQTQAKRMELTIDIFAASLGKVGDVASWFEYRRTHCLQDVSTRRSG